MTRSTAYSKLNVWTEVWPSRAACSAASLQMLAISAPVRTTGERRVSALLPWGLRGGKKGGAHKQVKGGQGARYRQRGVVRAGRWCSCSPRLKPFNTSDPKNHLFTSTPTFFRLSAFSTALLHDCNQQASQNHCWVFHHPKWKSKVSDSASIFCLACA